MTLSRHAAPARVPLLVLTAALALPAVVASQVPDRPEHAMGLAIGLSDFHQRDEYLAPVTYGGTILAGSALYERRHGRALLRVDAAATIGGTSAGALPRDARQYVARLSVTVLHALGDPGAEGRRWTVYVGGALTTFGAICDFKATDTEYGYTYEDVSWYWSHSLDLALRAEYRRGARSVSLQLSSPALRLVSRPENGKEYNAANDRVTDSWPRAMLGGRLEFPWENALVFGQAEYRQRLGGRLQLRAAYDFTYAMSDRPLALGMYMNQLQVGLLWPM